MHKNLYAIVGNIIKLRVMNKSETHTIRSNILETTPPVYYVVNFRNITTKRIIDNYNLSYLDIQKKLFFKTFKNQTIPKRFQKNKNP